MNSIIVFAAEDNLVKTFARVIPGAKVHDLPNGVSIESPIGNAIIRLDDDIHDQLDEEEQQTIEHIVGTPFHCYSLSFRDFRVTERLLQMVADRQLAIDNDHGIILPVPKFLGLIQHAPWDSSPDELEK